MGFYYFCSISFEKELHAKDITNRYFGQTFVFNNSNKMFNNEACRLIVNYNKDLEERFWVDIMPSGITQSGISSKEEADKANQFCNIMYGMLRNERYFDYAICGVEVQEFRTLKELKFELKEEYEREMIATGPWYISNGLVISKKILENFECKKEFENFSETHLWCPKDLEVFKEE